METKGYLSEERYQRTNKIIRRIALFILCAGFLAVGIILTVGFVNREKRYENELQALETSKSDTETEIADLQSEIDTLNEELIQLRTKQDQVFHDSSGFTEEYYRLGNEIFAKQKRLGEAEGELWDANKRINYARNTTVYKDSNFVFPAIGVAVMCSMTALTLFLFTKRRHVLAYTMQSVMPIAQEGVEKMAPSVGKIDEETAKGVYRARSAAAQPAAPAAQPNPVRQTAQPQQQCPQQGASRLFRRPNMNSKDDLSN